MAREMAPIEFDEWMEAKAKELKKLQRDLNKISAEELNQCLKLIAEYASAQGEGWYKHPQFLITNREVPHRGYEAEAEKVKREYVFLDHGSETQAVMKIASYD